MVDANSEQLLPACCFKLVLYNPFILSKVSSTARCFKLMAYHTLWLRLSNLNPMRSRAQFQLLLFSLQLYKDRTLANKGRRVRPATLAPHSHKPDRYHTNGDFFSTASHSNPMINHSINIWNKVTVEHIKGLDLSRIIVELRKQFLCHFPDPLPTFVFTPTTRARTPGTSFIKMVQQSKPLPTMATYVEHQFAEGKFTQG